MIPTRRSAIYVWCLMFDEVCRGHLTSLVGSFAEVFLCCPFYLLPAIFLFVMSDFTFDEINLMCIYNTGTRAGLMKELTDMRGHLEPDEAELLELTDSTLYKLGGITDEQFAELELVPDFDTDE